MPEPAAHPPRRVPPTASPVPCAWMPPFQAEAPACAGGATVSFEPGARTAWHTHPLGQTLLVVSGFGRLQRERGPWRSAPATSSGSRRREPLVSDGRLPVRSDARQTGFIEMTDQITGKTVVITGASSGLGAETARHLVRGRRQGRPRRPADGTFGSPGRRVWPERRRQSSRSTSPIAPRSSGGSSTTPRQLMAAST